MIWMTKQWHQPQWTPDGKHVVFFSEMDWNIYLARADGSELHKLFEEEREYFHSWNPFVSPDGSRIAYSTMRHPVEKLHRHHRPARHFDIETSTLDGKDRRRLTTDYGQDISPVWSPDGSRVAFERRHSESLPSGIYTVAADGTGEQLVFPFDLSNFDLSTPRPPTLLPRKRARSGSPEATSWRS